MLNQNGNSKPAASWGAVAQEALRHPIKNGVVDLTIGTADIAAGTIFRDPILAALGVGLDVYGALRFNRLANGMRYPTSSLH